MMEEVGELLWSMTYQQISAFLATHDRSDPEARRLVARIAERVHGEIYRRERETYPEWVDHGGEA